MVLMPGLLLHCNKQHIVYSETSSSGPSEKGHSIIKLSTVDNSWDPKILFPHIYNSNLRKEDNLSNQVNLYCL